MPVYNAYELTKEDFPIEYGLILSPGEPFFWLFSDVREAYEVGLPAPPPPPVPPPASIPTIVGELNTGETVSIVLYDSNMNSVPLDDATCPEKDATGFFYWSSNNMTTFPAEATIYFWVMTDTSGRRDYGTVEIGDRPVPDVAGSVWDALTASHTVPGSFGERVDAVPTKEENRQEMDGNSTKLTDILADTQRVDGLIEDVGGDRFTAKALEEAPASPAGPTKEEIRQEMDTNSTKLTDILADTQRVDGLIEDDGLGNDRFTAKALEEAGAGGLIDPIVKLSGNNFALARFAPGDTVTIHVYNPETGAEVGIQSPTCLPIGGTGCYYWPTTLMTPEPGATYLWVMNNGVETREGEFNFPRGDAAKRPQRREPFRFRPQ